MFGVGSTTGTLACTDLQVVDDNVVEVNEENLTLTMSADDPQVTTTTTLSATVTIMENDNDGNSMGISWVVFFGLVHCQV